MEPELGFQNHRGCLLDAGKKSAASHFKPVAWDEPARALKRKDEAGLIFTAEAAVKRIKKAGDLFAPVLQLKQELPATFTEALLAGPQPKLSRWPRNSKRRESVTRDKTLREYAAKRDLTGTSEAGSIQATRGKREKGPPRYVIQKHSASHLHYDWRLEMQGVLRSWAVPKGSPTQLREARLAMHVEDHPLKYEKFEGTIPPGNYGAGTVMVWDYGLYEDITENEAAAFHSGKMHLVMQGEKLKGEWILVKDKREPESNKWLLIKAGESMKPITAKADDTSAISKRSMAAIAKANDAQWQSNRPAAGGKSARREVNKKIAPKFIGPMQCKAVTALPKEGDWTFEIKFDGYRCLAVKNGSEVKVFSRNENVLDARFPGIVEAFAALPEDFTVDGEVVALDEEGRPSLQLLENKRVQRVAVYFYAFDLLNRDGQELIALPIERRRELLHKVISEPGDRIRLSPLLEADAAQVLDAVRKLGLEGVVGKRAGSTYESGNRSGAWIKLRTERVQEFAIGGYIPGSHNGR